MPKVKGQLGERIGAWLSKTARPTTVSELIELPASIGTTIGEVRKENQDRAVVARYTPHTESPFLLLAICDGVGGMLDGGKCAEIAIASVIESLVLDWDRPDSADNKLTTAVVAGNAQVYRRFSERGGTTIAALLFSGGVFGVTVGDTRIYTHTQSSRLKQVSIDDSIAGELNRLQVADRGDVDSLSNSLTQFVGMRDGIQPRRYRLEGMASGSAHYLLTSDGAHSISQETMDQFIAFAPNNLAIVTRLLHLSRWCGGKDNASIICASADISDKIRVGSGFPGTLEIWDSTSKLELSVNVLSPSEQLPAASTETQPPKLPPSNKPPRSKPRSSRKKNDQSTKLTVRDLQQPLNISITDSDSQRQGEPEDHSRKDNK